MKKKTKEIYEIVLRYFLIILAAFSNLWIFYLLFTPLTVYPVYFLLSLFSNGVTLVDNIISFKSYSIWIIKACVAGSAYYLLFILNLATPKIKIKKRLKILIFSFGLLLVANILRIVILALLLDSFWFDFTHKLLWNLLSTIFVVGTWLTMVILFKIKDIPFYSDIKNFYKKSLLKK